MQSDKCFRCQKPGHWTRDCPERSGASLSNCLGSSRIMPVTTDPEFPSTYCRCGRGLCHIVVSKTPTNPNRKFYRCPGAGPENCNYFKWCDALRMDQVLASPPELKFPTCGCKAGVCKLEYKQHGPNAGRNYFCCPINKGEGACDFFMWQDDYIITARNNQGRWAISNEESVDAQIIGGHDHSSVEILEPTDGPEASPGPSPRQLLVKHGVPGMTVENAIANSSANNANASTPKTGAEPQTVQFRRQMATPNAPADSVEATIWPRDTPTAESEKRMKLNPSSSQASRKLNVIEPSIYQKDPVAGYVDEVTVYLKTKLISSLESLDPSKHKIMLDMADHTFPAMQNVDADFYYKVMEYISRAAALAELQQSCPNYLSSEELKAKYDAQRSHLEEISQEKTEITYTLMVKKQSLCDLRSEVSHYKEMVSAAEKKLSACELEINSLEARLYKISEEMLQSKQGLQDAVEAIKNFDMRDIDLGAAETAFETARATLYV